MQKVKIENRCYTKIVVKYKIHDEDYLEIIEPGTSKKINVFEEKLIHIKHVDDTSARFLMSNHPVNRGGDVRMFNFVYYNKFDCVIDVTDFYSTVVVQENSYGITNRKIFSVYRTSPDLIVKQYFITPKDLLLLKMSMLIIPTILILISSYILLIGISCILFWIDFWFGLFLTLIGLAILLYCIVRRRKTTPFKEARINDVMEDADLIVIKKISDCYLEYDFAEMA